MADFVTLGLGIGALAPASVLLPMAWLQRPSSGLVYTVQMNADLVQNVLLPAAGLGGALGIPVGIVLWACTRLARERPLWLVPVGFPVGLGAGGAAGYLLANQASLGSGSEGFVGVLGAMCGGLLLGFAWLPYLAMKLRGRSGLPLVVGAIGMSVVVGPLTMATVLFLF